MSNEIQKALEQDARRVKERILMGAKWEQANDAAEKLKIFLEEENWTQTAVAKKLGVSNTMISHFLQNKYKGDTASITKALIDFLNTYARKKNRDINNTYIETSVAKQIHTLITQTEACSDGENGKIGLVIGDSGHGKSKCLEVFAKAHPNTVYIELDEGMNPTTMFNEIAEKLGVGLTGSLAAITRRLIEYLKPRSRIIILDEASGLKVKHLNLLRQIIVVKCRCPLILAGNRDLQDTIFHPKALRGSESLDQFTSRLMYTLNLDELAHDRNGGLYTVSDIRKLYEYGGIRLTTDAVRTLRKIAKTDKSGRLHICRHIISVLHIAKEVIETKQIDSDLIIRVIHKLKLLREDKLPIISPGMGDEEQQTAAAAKIA